MNLFIENLSTRKPGSEVSLFPGMQVRAKIGPLLHKTLNEPWNGSLIKGFLPFHLSGSVGWAPAPKRPLSERPLHYFVLH